MEIGNAFNKHGTILITRIHGCKEWKKIEKEPINIYVDSSEHTTLSTNNAKRILHIQ